MTRPSAREFPPWGGLGQIPGMGCMIPRFKGVGACRRGKCPGMCPGVGGGLDSSLISETLRNGNRAFVRRGVYLLFGLDMLLAICRYLWETEASTLPE